MPIILSLPLSVPEIRVLQEFRRLSIETLSADAIKKIKHPTGRGEVPELSLIDKGYLTADAGREKYSLTDKAKSMLAIDHKPTDESGGGGAESA